MATAAWAADAADTLVVDPEDLTMQVKIVDEDGLMFWHRWLPGSNGAETACGVQVVDRLSLGIRYEICEGEMCPECFTPRELVKAHLANRAARDRTR